MSGSKKYEPSQAPGAAKNRLDELLDFAAHCTPTEWEAFDESLNNPRVYVKQLEKIEAPAKDITDAVIQYHKGFTNRIKWLEDKLVTEGDLDVYEGRLKYHHTLIFEGKRDENDSEVKQGQYILKECQRDAHLLQIGVRSPYTGFSDGALHTLADNAIIGWHPKWKEFFKKEEAK